MYCEKKKLAKEKTIGPQKKLEKEKIIGPRKKQRISETKTGHRARKNWNSKKKIWEKIPFSILKKEKESDNFLSEPAKNNRKKCASPLLNKNCDIF